jgi:hypothetical protein
VCQLQLNPGVGQPDGDREVQLILADASYDHPEVDRDALLAAARELMAELSGEIEVTDSDIGKGADWPVFLVTLGGLFFLGKRINENLQAWLELAQKIANLLRSGIQPGHFGRAAEALWLAAERRSVGQRDGPR